MRHPDRFVYDYATNAWVLPDGFNTPAEAEEILLEVPETAPSLGHWTKPAPPRRSNEPMVIGLVWVAIGFVVAAIVLHTLAIAGLAGLCLILAIVAYDAQALTDTRVTDADRMLLEDPDDRDVCLVHLTVSHDGETVGTDKGVVWFDSGRLLFNGHRTSFAIGGEDVLPFQNWYPWVARSIGANGTQETELPERIVPLRVPKGRAHVELVPLMHGNAGSSPNEMRFLKNLYAFRRRPPRSTGPRQWPPFSVT